MSYPLVEGGSIDTWDPLPCKVYRKHGAYYLVHNNKWYRLGREPAESQARLAQLQTEVGERVVDLGFLRHLFLATKKRAKNSDFPFTITHDDVIAMWHGGGGRCAVTGVPLTEANPDRLKRRPWLPSLDRIDSRLGYTPENTRLVCCAVNVAMNVWGTEVFGQLAEGYLARRPTLPA